MGKSSILLPKYARDKQVCNKFDKMLSNSNRKNIVLLVTSVTFTTYFVTCKHTCGLNSGPLLSTLKVSLKKIDYRHSSIYAVNVGIQKKNQGSKNRINRGYLLVLKGRKIG